MPPTPAPSRRSRAPLQSGSAEYSAGLLCATTDLSAVPKQKIQSPLQPRREQQQSHCITSALAPQPHTSRELVDGGQWALISGGHAHRICPSSAPPASVEDMFKSKHWVPQGSHVPQKTRVRAASTRPARHGPQL